MTVEHSFAVQIVCIRCILFELNLMKKKKERRSKKKEEQNRNFMFDFLDCEKKSWESWTIFDIRIAKGFHL